MFPIYHKLLSVTALVMIEVGTYRENPITKWTKCHL